MRIDQAFRPMVELEKAMADLYASWAELFAADQEAVVLFFKMSREEKGHASLIEYQQRVFRSNQQFSTNVEIDLTAIEASIGKIRTLRTVTPPPSLEEALVMALELEESAAESFYKTTLKQANAEVELLLNRLGGDDAAHSAALREFAAKRGIPIPD